MIPMSQINGDFSEDTEPKDDRLIELLGLAYAHKIDCQLAIIPMTMIKPFSDFKPGITEAMRAKFVEDYETLKPWQVYVYAKDGMYIMSDDYLSYYLYLELKLPEALCVILDAKPDDRIQAIDEPFKLPLPTAEIIDTSEVPEN